MALRSVMTIACAQLYDNGASVNVIPFGDDAKYSLSCGQLIYHGLNSVSYLLCTEIVRQARPLIPFKGCVFFTS